MEKRLTNYGVKRVKKQKHSKIEKTKQKSKIFTEKILDKVCRTGQR